VTVTAYNLPACHQSCTLLLTDAPIPLAPTLFHPPAGKERQSVGGTIGGQNRKEQMAADNDGDVSKGYAEMGQKGGSVTNEDTGNA
jgi:hypothetical protein